MRRELRVVLLDAAVPGGDNHVTWMALFVDGGPECSCRHLAGWLVSGPKARAKGTEGRRKQAQQAPRARGKQVLRSAPGANLLHSPAYECCASMKQRSKARCRPRVPRSTWLGLGVGVGVGLGLG